MTTDKQRQQARIRQQRWRDKHKAAGKLEVRIVTDCQAKAAKIKAAAIEINADSTKQPKRKLPCV